MWNYFFFLCKTRVCFGAMFTVKITELLRDKVRLMYHSRPQSRMTWDIVQGTERSRLVISLPDWLADTLTCLLRLCYSMRQWTGCNNIRVQEWAPQGAMTLSKNEANHDKWILLSNNVTRLVLKYLPEVYIIVLRMPGEFEFRPLLENTVGKSFSFASNNKQ